LKIGQRFIDTNEPAYNAWQYLESTYRSKDISAQLILEGKMAQLKMKFFLFSILSFGSSNLRFEEILSYFQSSIAGAFVFDPFRGSKQHQR
jgi:hypothetical protein